MSTCSSEAHAQAGYAQVSTEDSVKDDLLSLPRPLSAAASLQEGTTSRKTSKRRAPYSFYAFSLGQEKNRLGEVYNALVAFLQSQRSLDWDFNSNPNQTHRCNLVLGESQAAGIEWAKLGTPGSKPLVNFYRGFEMLTRKTLMAQSLRAYADSDSRIPLALDTFLPKTFVFTKKCQERVEFREEFQRRKSNGLDNTWILKPSGGAHGDDIVVMNQEADILSFLEMRQEIGSPWVIQKYCQNPMLLPGERKFDVRCMVLVAHDYSIYLYSEGIIRSCSVRYSLDDLSDRFAHLANHCLQEHHPEYGKYESLNLLSYDAFDKFLRESGMVAFDGRPARLETHVMPQIEAQIVYALAAVKEGMEVMESSNYRCFNLLGFDFMLDDQSNVFLLEVNSSPTTDSRLIPHLVEELIHVAVDPLFPPQMAITCGESSASTAMEGGHGLGVFKLLNSARVA